MTPRTPWMMASQISARIPARRHHRARRRHAAGLEDREDGAAGEGGPQVVGDGADGGDGPLALDGGDARPLRHVRGRHHVVAAALPLERRLVVAAAAVRVDVVADPVDGLEQVGVAVVAAGVGPAARGGAQAVDARVEEGGGGPVERVEGRAGVDGVVGGVDAGADGPLDLVPGRPVGHDAVPGDDVAGPVVGILVHRAVVGGGRRGGPGRADGLADLLEAQGPRAVGPPLHVAAAGVLDGVDADGHPGGELGGHLGEDADGEEATQEEPIGAAAAAAVLAAPPPPQVAVP